MQIDNGSISRAIRKNQLLVEREKLPKGFSDGFQQLCHNRWIFLGSSIGTRIETEDCEIAEINDVIYRESWGIIVWKGFPLKKVLNKL